MLRASTSYDETKSASDTLELDYRDIAEPENYQNMVFEKIYFFHDYCSNRKLFMSFFQDLPLTSQLDEQ